ncbi:MAG: DUF5671 domain-containing protein [Patescibacteria group bacterium]|nr:DUF5671 domain-containing protein [Patescibacteria group bacterium]
MNNNAKFTFFYLLSLVSLIFTALGTGMILFQIINKQIFDVGADYGNSYTDEAMRFGIAALFVAAPVYFLITRAINKSVIKGELDKESPIRKWLTYFILFIASVTVLSWVIGTLNVFLKGDLTIKFALKMATVLIIAGTTFGYYLYDIRRNVVAKGDKALRIFAFSAIGVVGAAFIASWFFVDSPYLARAKRIDDMTSNELNSLQANINEYYNRTKKLPENLEALRSDQSNYVGAESLIDFNNHPYGYKIIDSTHYELCAEFLADSKLETRDNRVQYSYAYPQTAWEHKVGGDNCYVREVKLDQPATPVKF